MKKFKSGDKVFCIPRSNINITGAGPNDGPGSGYEDGRVFIIARVSYNSDIEDQSVAWPSDNGPGVFFRSLKLIPIVKGERFKLNFLNKQYGNSSM